jgi:hypothetical protein
MSADRALVDTNVLVCSVYPSAAQHPGSRALVESAKDPAAGLYVLPQQLGRTRMRLVRCLIVSAGLVGLAGCDPGPGGPGTDSDHPDAGDLAAWDLRPAAADAPLFAASKQRHGVYPVGSRVRDELAPGGFGPCARYPKDLGDKDWGEAGKVSLIAFPDETVRFGDCRGLAIRLINRTDRTVAFQASDSCLYLVQEARTEAGDWRPIESLPMVICGNSFHRVFLKPDQYWELPAPRYDGPVKTKIRFRLDPGGEQEPARLPIYSGEFEGQISRAQFGPEPEDPRP